ncbi:Testosterone 17-beta-dehydrogenase 3 [Acipenser ruthenus]|uniref:Testosterone 17-beta-dehydrogenase 3 n=1 Tax=Acipenser ruthenus TaxID=7906 RepID=A0A662YL12_ACIRT|nr:Testosterone 17-beta-dehydrogenase 3 [Acipenser ruthenus]
MGFVDLILISLGAIVALVYVLKFIKLVKILFPKTWCPLSRSFFSSLGEWAVITGGTDGIGRAYAFELAKRGMNIVLISRTLEKLNKVAKEIEDDTGRSVKVIASDFTREDIYENIEDNLKGLDVGILVNNVGMLFSPIPCRFLDVENLDTVFVDRFSRGLQAEYGYKGVIIQALIIKTIPLWVLHSSVSQEKAIDYVKNRLS